MQRSASFGGSTSSSENPWLKFCRPDTLPDILKKTEVRTKDFSSVDAYTQKMDPYIVEHPEGYDPVLQVNDLTSMKYKKQNRTLPPKLEREVWDIQPGKLKPGELYVPSGASYMAPHPCSGLRTSFKDDPTVDMKKVHAMRRLGASPVPTSISLTDVPLASDPAAKEYKSNKDLHKWRKKHVRTLNTNFQKFSGEMLHASLAVGWALDDPDNPYKPFAAQNSGITETKETKYYHNMKMTGMEMILRSAH